jgi:hypothetical protein
MAYGLLVNPPTHQKLSWLDNPKNIGLLSAALGILANNKGHYGAFGPAVGAGGLLGLQAALGTQQQNVTNRLNQETLDVARNKRLKDAAIEKQQGNWELEFSKQFPTLKLPGMQKVAFDLPYGDSSDTDMQNRYGQFQTPPGDGGPDDEDHTDTNMMRRYGGEGGPEGGTPLPPQPAGIGQFIQTRSPQPEPNLAVPGGEQVVPGGGKEVNANEFLLASRFWADKDAKKSKTYLDLYKETRENPGKYVVRDVGVGGGKTRTAIINIEGFKEGKGGNILAYVGEPKTPQPLVQIAQTQERAEAAKVGGGQGEMYVKLQQGGLDAQPKIDRFTRLSSLLEGVNTGKLTPLGTQIAAYAQSLGMDIDPQLGNKQAAEALSSELALQLRNPSGGAGMPGALSDKDREFLVGMVPGIAKTPEGRKLVVETAVKMAQRDKDVAKLARDYRKKHGQFDEGFFDELEAFSQKNPLFTTKAPEQKIKKIMGDADFNKLPSGTKFQGPDGVVRVKP